MRGVFELTRPLLVEHQRLDPLEGGEEGLGAAGAEGRYDDGVVAGQPTLQQHALVLLVRPEHEGGAHTLLQHGRQHTPAENTIIAGTLGGARTCTDSEVPQLSVVTVTPRLIFHVTVACDMIILS